MLTKLLQKWKEASEKRKAYNELHKMSDYQLKDIGLTRGNIREAVYGEEQ